MRRPDSLLSAAKKVAEATGLAWAEVQPIYRALQEPGGVYNSPWLPKSVGRTVWSAYPRFIGHLLVALAVAHGRSSKAHDALVWVYATSPGGRRIDLTEHPAAGIFHLIEPEIIKLLIDPERADSLDEIEFQTDQRRVVFKFFGKESSAFELPEAARDLLPPRNERRLIHHRAVIDGEVFRKLSEKIKWRLNGDAPVEFAPEDLSDDEGEH